MKLESIFSKQIYSSCNHTVLPHTHYILHSMYSEPPFYIHPTVSRHPTTCLASLANLEATWHELLEHLSRVVLLGDTLQELDVLGAITANRLLRRSREVDVQEAVKVLASGLGDSIDPLAGHGVHGSILRGVNPAGSDEGDDQVLGVLVKTEGVTAVGTSMGRVDLGGGNVEVYPVEVGDGLVVLEVDLVGGVVHGVEGGLVVLEGDGGGGVAEAIGLVLVELGGDVADGAHAHGVHDLGLDLGEGSETGGVGSTVGAGQGEGDDGLAGRSVGDDDLGTVVNLLVVEGGELGEGVQGGVGRVGEVRDDDGTTPELGNAESSDIDAGDNTEVVASTLESLEKIGVALLVGVDDGTGGKDNLVVDNVVDDPAVAGEKVGLASTSRDTTDTSATAETTWNEETLIGELSVDLTPPGTSSELHSGSISSEVNGVEGTEDNGNTTVDVVGSRERVMATGLDGESA